MSNLSGSENQQEYEYLVWLSRESMDCGCGWLVEHLYRNDGGVSTPDDLRHFGELAEEIHRWGLNEEREGNHLCKLAVAASKQFGVHLFNTNHPDKPFTDMLFELGRQRRDHRLGYDVDRLDDARAFAAILNAAKLLLAMGAERQVINENPQAIIELAHSYAVFEGWHIPFDNLSLTLRAFAQPRSVCDFISTGAVERLREHLSARHRNREARTLN